MTENQQRNDYQEFIELSDNRAYVEQAPKEPYKSELFDNPAVKALPLYLVVGAILGLGIGIFFKTLAKKSKKRSKRFKKQQPLQIIRPEFREETKREREHRLKQRKKYGIFDENGNRIDKL